MNNTLNLLDRPIAFHRIFAQITGSVSAGLFLSQCWYWSSRTKNPEGWFYKSQAEWQEETCLKRQEQEAARRALKSLGILQEKKEGIPAKLYYKLDKTRLGEIITGYATGNFTPQTRLPKNNNLDKSRVSAAKAHSNPRHSQVAEYSANLADEFSADLTDEFSADNLYSNLLLPENTPENTLSLSRTHAQASARENPENANAERERIFEKVSGKEIPEKPTHNPLSQLEPKVKTEFLKFCTQHYESNNPGKKLALAQEYAKKYFDELWELFQNSIAPKANLEPSMKNEETAIAICENFPIEEWPEWIAKYLPRDGEYFKRFEHWYFSRK
jgi:hypothetical protein